MPNRCLRVGRGRYKIYEVKTLRRGLPLVSLLPRSFYPPNAGDLECVLVGIDKRAQHHGAQTLPSMSESWLKGCTHVVCLVQTCL
jgi:hypothetical protein